jgi:hypothetical protein
MRRERSAVLTRLVLAVALVSCVFVVGEPILETGTAAGVPLRRCTPEGYGLAQMLARPVSAGQAVRLTAGWLTAMEKRRRCRLHTTIRLTIKGSKGLAATAEWTVTSVRRPWTGIAHTWVWRNWCTADQGNATVEFHAPGERTTRQTISKPPACVSPGAPSTVADVGTGTKYVKRQERFQPHILPKRAPPALHHEVLAVKNGWLVSDGYTLVAVYAGSPGIDPSIGRFGIIRQSAIFGVQYDPPDLIDVGKVGALKITDARRGRSRETTAQYGRLSFVAANGTKGVIELTGDHIRITSRPPPSG